MSWKNIIQWNARITESANKRSPSHLPRKIVALYKTDVFPLPIVSWYTQRNMETQMSSSYNFGSGDANLSDSIKMASKMGYYQQKAPVS